MSGITRREFLKTGAKGAALVAIPVIFRLDPLAAFAAPSPTRNLGDYMTHFGVDESLIRKVMGAALAHGGDYCDLFFEHTISYSVNLEDDEVNRAYSNIDFGVGIRVIEGEQTGYSFTEDITPNALIQAAKTAANIASESKTLPPANLSRHDTPDYYPIETLVEDNSITQKIPLLKKVNERMLSRDKRIIKTRAGYADSASYILIATSDGRVVCDYRPMAALHGVCIAEQNGQRETNYYALRGRYGLDYFDEKKINEIGDKAVQKTVVLFDAVVPEGGEMEVVLAPGDSGILLHEAIGHGMEADANRKGESIFADKINKKVAEDFVTIVDDGTLLHDRGALNVDDEANATEKTCLVENGILRSYLHDRISSRYYKVNPTGSGRRQSFRYSPIPRMRSTYMLNGPHKREEIIQSVKKGLYAESFQNGEVRIGQGDFTFYLNNGYLIEDGKLTRPVKDLNLVGNGPDVLTKMVMVADDMVIDPTGGNCGKAGQYVPVTLGLPTVKVSSITVGGRSA